MTDHMTPLSTHKGLIEINDQDTFNAHSLTFLQRTPPSVRKAVTRARVAADQSEAMKIDLIYPPVDLPISIAKQPVPDQVPQSRK